jgi:hypothetical protein
MNQFVQTGRYKKKEKKMEEFMNDRLLSKRKNIKEQLPCH